MAASLRAVHETHRVMPPNSLRQALAAHLESWRLTRFTEDAEYFAWQRRMLRPEQLGELHRCVERKRRGTDADEAAFYDATADPAILPVLYSQRYDYYLAVGARVASRLAEARSILDFGCGVGILTTFYARVCPDSSVVGVDRSRASIAQAQEAAQRLGLQNVRFQCLDAAQQPLSGGVCDCIVATHALVQAEHDPGVPSRNWTTFERAHDPESQQAFEARTGLGARLDRLRAALAPSGRVLVFEKTRTLARRVPFQRALAARGLALISEPEWVRYVLVEEVVDDGPFYVAGATQDGRITWDESPEPDEGRLFEPPDLSAAATDLPGPLYENHRPSAQEAWNRLGHRQVELETTRDAGDGRQMHVELGIGEGFPYLYCANTYDQRQLVIMGPGQRDALEQYYAEIVSQSP